MIRVERQNIEFKGATWDVMAELTVAIRALRKRIEEEKDKEFADRMIDRVFHLSKLTSEEIDAEAKKALKEMDKALIKGALKDIFGDDIFDLLKD